MTRYELVIKIDGSLPRRELRKKVVEQILLEEAGTGRGEKTSKYIYYVEELEDGSRIYLTRPAYLKKGFDFLIHVKDKVFMNGKDNPKHDDIFEDLRKKKKENPILYKRLHEAITRVYSCEDPSEVLKEFSDLKFKSGFSFELILKTLKWFFIEQDIRDWNYSGRAMLKSGLDEIASQATL